MWGTSEAASGSTENLTGLLGVAARGIETLGEWGVGLFTLAETVLPPIPSEVILPLAGYLAKQGSLNLVLIFITSTLGAYLGALLLYWLGAKLGLERSIRGLSRLPLVDREDFDHAAGWFGRHGRSSIFFGRLLPGVRSLISLPAGASNMHLGTFSVYTLGGSGLWNGALIGLGYALGTQYQVIEQYSRFLNYAVYLALGLSVLWLVVRSVRRSRAGRR
ncbi:DedA family protein [Arthrobacter sp. HMWF013]|uniref:DedA family protein n=1 Tax=Arthrobacter sp. HMWF013 TaxID=2056849 RepID=UPI000D38BAF4|nr:DedA family protein [Arthrobacter sp. HMWF013]PTT69605.1 DedA family protein [Arthrobacter sp. HMWF013]